MGVNRILLHNLKKNLVKHIIILVISIITLVTAIVSISFEKITLGIRTKQLSEITMNEEIIVSLGEEDPETIASLIETVDNIVLTVPKTISSVFTDICEEQFTLYGVDYGVQNNLSRIPVIEGDISTAENRGIMISRELSEKYSLSVGDEVDILVGESQETLIVSAICDEQCSLFENYSTCLLADRVLVEEISGTGVNRIDISLENPELIDKTVNAVGDVLADHDVEISQKYDSSFYNSFVSTIVFALRIFVVFAVIMAIYLIYSLYRTLILEQSAEMAVLRTVGMSLRGYVLFVLKQTLVTFAIASLASFFISKLFIMLMISIFVGYNGEYHVNFNPVLLISVYGSFLVICTLSVIAGIKKQVSMPLVGILKSGVCQDVRKRYKCLFGYVFLASAVILYHLSVKNSFGLIMSLVFTLIAMILLSETAVGCIVFVTDRLRMSRYTIGLKQLSSSKSNYTLIFDLAAFVIVLMIVANSVSSDLSGSISRIYGDQSVYTEVYSELSDEELKSIATDISADDTLRLRKAMVEIGDSSYSIEAVPVEDYSRRDYEYVKGEKVSHKEMFERLFEKNSVIISSTVAKNLDLEKGDSFVCGGIELEVKGIAATYDNMGSMIYTSYETLGELQYDQSFDVILFRCGSPNTAVEKITERADELSVQIFVQTISELFKTNNERNQLMIRIIQVLSGFMGIVALICLYNTVKICLRQRIGNYVILRTVGADRGMLTLTEIIESIVDSGVNMLYALPFSFFINKIVRDIVSFYFGEGGRGHFDIRYIMIIALVIVSAYVICKLILLKSSLFRVNIVESIKKQAM